MIASLIAIPFAWLFTPVMVFGFFRGRMDLFPHQIGIAFFFGVVPAWLLMGLSANGPVPWIALSAVGVAFSIAFMIWWLYRLFECARIALVAKH